MFQFPAFPQLPMDRCFLEGVAAKCRKKYINIVQNSDRVDLSTSCKMTHNFGASVTFALKSRHCVGAIFLVFRVCWEARGMACGPCFLAQNNVRRLVIRTRFGDLRHEQLGTCFFPVLRHNHVLVLKRCMADVVEKGQSFNGVGKSLCIWKIHCSKKNSYVLFENWIWGHANILTLEGQKDNF